MRKIAGTGPKQADVVIVGEFPNNDDELTGAPFAGTIGKELKAWLREAGISSDDCYFTNVVKYRPPANDITAWMTDKKKTGIKNGWTVKGKYWYNEIIAEGLAELQEEVFSRHPKIVVGLGNLALWAFTDQWGITSWRGSEMPISTPSDGTILFVPTLTPGSIIRNWPSRVQATHDINYRVQRRLRTGLVEPHWNFNIAPALSQVLSFLEQLSGEVAIDVETSRGKIVCVGIAWSKRDAICIPFQNEDGIYWSSEDYKTVINALSTAMRKPNVQIIGQNFAYDTSYFVEDFKFLPRVSFDTLIAQSVLFPGTERNLGYLSSMYCDWHCYWKDDARDWNNLKDFESLFIYNCRDTCSTWEIAQIQRKQLVAAKLTEQFADRMQYGHHVFDMMQRGVNRDPVHTNLLEVEAEEALHHQQLFLTDKAGYPINPASPKQVSQFLFKELKLGGTLKKSPKITTSEPDYSTGKDEIKKLLEKHQENPVISEILQTLLQYRALNSLRNNFLHACLDPDGRLRSGFMATGTETFRLTSGKNNFRRGTNLLNVTGREESRSGTKVPNMRRCIIPDNGYTIFDCDLERADLQVVVWEAGDEDLKAKMREGVDIHMENAKDVFGTASPTDFQRESAKQFVHLSDYLGRPRTAAIKCGMTVHAAELAQRRWFQAHPGILAWHKRVIAQIQRSRYVTNKFGYRYIFFDRIDDSVYRDAVAWIPQSTIAIVASQVHMNIDNTIPDAQMQVQMYDSVMGQYPTNKEAEILPLLLTATKVTIPYEDTLIIPMGIKTSEKSWGDVKKRENGWQP